MSMCFRCQHRVDCLEGASAPRCECDDFEHSKYTCYMFIPIKPVVLTKLDPSDKRPQFGPWTVAARSRYVGEVTEEEFELALKQGNKTEAKGTIVYWRPKKSSKKGGGKDSG